ncbi:hypothetical protein [Pseudonocardia sp.]|jgi:hypothetical protein|uniref:hypothetical protein n=1 Tax=Pseudonocardia sp. TaxID=60912 RepID=UPI0031FC6C06
MITMTPNIVEIHGTRLRVGFVMPMAGSLSYARAWKQRPAVVALGAILTDNSTGVSEVECRHT